MVLTSALYNRGITQLKKTVSRRLGQNDAGHQGAVVPNLRHKLAFENACTASESAKAGLANETHLLNRQLSPGEDIVLLAEELAVDYICVGVRKKSKVGKVLFGSAAQYIILNAPCPVVTTK